MPNAYETINDDLWLETLNPDYLNRENKVFTFGSFTYTPNNTYFFDIQIMSPKMLKLNGKIKIIKIKCGFEYIVINKSCVLAIHFIKNES